MDHAIEHIVGVYIVLVGIACLVGILTKWLAHVPYTIALVLVGLALAVFRLGPDIQETGFGKELVFFVLLPPLLFQGAFHMQIDHLRRVAVPVLVFATLGVVASTLLIGVITYEIGAFKALLVAMLFGALICTTDPVSVLAIFRSQNVPTGLKYMIEGESLFNDGTGVVMYTIILSMVLAGGEVHLGGAVLKFIVVSAGGAVVGLAFGYACYHVLRRITDHLLENMICLVLCFGVFWIAEHYHLSGVIAVVCAGVLLGNRGRALAMSQKTVDTIETFFESLEFLINSLLFILIGLELKAIPEGHVGGHALQIGLAIGAVLVARALVVYPLFFATRRFAGRTAPRWSHVLFWGGVRGSIPIALLLGLPNEGVVAQHRADLLVVGFAVVCFSLVVQGLTMKPLIAWLGLGPDKNNHDQTPVKSADGSA